jgi:phosphonopyruvate decarboxylase
MIALGIAKFSKNRVVCIDGDGAALMHFGALPVIGHYGPATLHHVVINNGAHESVGGQPTLGFSLDFPALARESGYKWAQQVETEEALSEALEVLKTHVGPALLEVRVAPGSRASLGRPTTTPIENRRAFMRALEGL